MSDILTKLYEAKGRVLAEEQAREPLAALADRAEKRRAERRSFRNALFGARGAAVIAEIKRASPSAGLIARNFDPAAVAALYQSAGADAISVLTESDNFLGELAYLDVARGQSRLPILRKDFLTCAYQVVQSAAYGADAILAIVAGLTDEQLGELVAEAARWNLDVLVEVHDESELKRALALKVTLLGINNRNLRTFETNISVTEHLIEHVPPGVFVVSESGLRSPDDIRHLAQVGARGFLIGESLMRSEDPVALIASLKSATSVRA
ncbi:MAG TPA: indole-3-glycerol phosphate synthase TrpC [Candidatus Acidoferrales bacterium]|nr:indole-3-glycerol phosphate synthase TrpC [Candidatus Acidoferrales bacterium]